MFIPLLHFYATQIAQNIATSSKDHHVKDSIIKKVKIIKQENLEKLMQSSDIWFELLDLNSNIRDIFENVKKMLRIKKSIFSTSLENIGK